MLNLYTIDNAILKVLPREEVHRNLDKLVWLDLHYPTDEEEEFAESLFKIDIPTRDEMHEIEPSSRLYIENGSLYTTTTIITKADTLEPETHAITFMLTGNCLITVRYSDPKPFQIVLSPHSTITTGDKGNTIFAKLLNAIINRLADILEGIGHNIDTTTSEIFRANSPKNAAQKPNLEEILCKIGVNGDLVSKTRESLISITRLISFIGQTPFFKNTPEEHLHIETMLHDIHALNDHADFLSSKLTFLLDATLGKISIEQNSIIKIFSVAAVIFLPPTLVASIYGMNFDFMPELKWHIGYPLALTLMLISAVLPYLFFRKKGWL
jgi:magnesium transporter